jgi:two-component system KDP operon response regulator KdpE
MTEKNINPKTILVVMNDKPRSLEIRKTFKDLGYEVISISEAQEAVDICIKSIIDLIILDLNLPDSDGMYVIDAIRKFNNELPIIVATGRSNIESKIFAFDAGANDYIVKPYNILELVARVKNQFRYLKVDDRHIFKNGNFLIDFDAKNVFVNGVEVHFTNFEYKIIVLLANNIDKSLSHEYIINHVWGEGGQDAGGLRVFMAGIRKKISKDTSSSKLIRTEIGTGYRMNSIK